MSNILIIDDDRSIQESFISMLEEKHSVYCAYNSKEALDIINKIAVDLIFLDYRLQYEDGLTVLQTIKKIEPDMFVVMITAYGNTETIIQASSLGVYEYMEKPLDIDKIELIVKRVLKQKKNNSYIKTVKGQQFENYNFKRIIGKTKVMQDLFKQIGKLINNDVTVLICGESGVGKELIAKAFHYNSSRKDEPFIAVNCSGLSENLLDNELFGHDPQAFTGATTKTEGKLEAAGDGTLFLDEIGDMPFNIQSKLLRVLQEKEFSRLGSTKIFKLKAKIIAATNKNLLEKVKKNEFRQDLFYRINVAQITVPPLSDRKDDIPLLTDWFFNRIKIKLNKNIYGISEHVYKLLSEYSWPGNVRELENLITTLCINVDNKIIDMEDIPLYIKKKTSVYNKENTHYLEAYLNDFIDKHKNENNIYPLLINEIEEKLFQKISDICLNNKSMMAKMLGISRMTLNKKNIQNSAD